MISVLISNKIDAPGFFCPAFAHAVHTMKEGEEAVLIVKPKCKQQFTKIMPH
jgi:hypothetical protein